MSSDTTRHRSSSNANMAKGLLLGVALGGLGIATPFIAAKISDSVSDSGPQQYQDVRYVRSMCPSLQPMVDQALADGMLSRSEAMGIGERMETMTRAANEYAHMAPARRDLGLGVKAPPPRCNNQRPGNDYAIGPILDPLWIR